MSKLKVLLVTHDLKVGGLQRLVVDIALNLDREIFDAAVCCLRELGPMAESLAADSIPVYQMHQVANGKTNYLSFLDLYKLLKEKNIDIVHTHNTNPMIDGGLAAILARTPVRIHTDHAREFPDKMRYMLAEKLLSFSFDEIIAVSEQTKSDLVNYEKISPEKISVIQNGVGFKQVESSRQNREPNPKFIIGAVGRLCDAKGFAYLIKSVPYLLKHTTNFEIQIVGDGELRQPLQNQVDDLGVSEYVRLVGESNDVGSYYRRFDLFVISSIREGLPLVLLEAMANRVPLVTTNVGGIPNVVKDRESAYIIQPHDAVAIAENVWYAIDNKEVTVAQAEKAYEIFEDQYSIGKMMSEYQSVYLAHAKSYG
jgi:glycosyltransferase involved in cell wall biosynthesis